MSELNCFILKTTQMARILGSKESHLLSKTEHKLSEKHLDSRAFVIQLLLSAKNQMNIKNLPQCR